MDEFALRGDAEFGVDPDEVGFDGSVDSPLEMSCHILPNSNVIPGGVGEVGIAATAAAAANAWARATGKKPRNFPLNANGGY